MQIQFLGTGAGIPSQSRNVSAIALKMLDERNEIWLFDCGEATQHNILKTHIRPRKVTKIFITHLHGDHVFGLPGFLSSRAFQGGESALTIFGPKGIKQFVTTALDMTHCKLKYKIEFKELETEGIAYEDEKIVVSYTSLKHGIQSYAYKVTEKDIPGELLVDKLRQYAIPNGPIFGRLKKGEIVVLEDGTVLNGKDFLAPDRKGRVVVVCGDTRYHTNHVSFFKDADVLVHESTYGKGDEKLAHAHFHATCTQAAQLALKANVKQLYLTHISARYLSKDVAKLEKDAAEIFKNTKVACDLLTVDIPLSTETNEN